MANRRHTRWGWPCTFSYSLVRGILPADQMYLASGQVASCRLARSYTKSPTKSPSKFPKGTAQGPVPGPRAITSFVFEKKNKPNRACALPKRWKRQSGDVGLGGSALPNQNIEHEVVKNMYGAMGCSRVLRKRASPSTSQRAGRQ